MLRTRNTTERINIPKLQDGEAYPFSSKKKSKSKFLLKIYKRCVKIFLVEKTLETAQKCWGWGRGVWKFIC